MTQTPTGPDRLTIVKLLADGNSPEFVAAATGHDRETVLAVGANHGYPDTAKLSWAADVLQQQTDEIPPAEHTTTADLIAPDRDTRPAPTARKPAAAPTPAPAAPPAERDTAVALIAAGTKSTRKRTRDLAARAQKALDVLAAEVEKERAAKREAARKAAEEARIRSEVERLEAELASKKALLTKSRAAKGSAATRAHVDPKTVRAWARSNGVDVPAAGRVPNRVVQAYLDAQNGRAA